MTKEAAIIEALNGTIRALSVHYQLLREMESQDPLRDEPGIVYRSDILHAKIDAVIEKIAAITNQQAPT